MSTGLTSGETRYRCTATVERFITDRSPEEHLNRSADEKHMFSFLMRFVAGSAAHPGRAVGSEDIRDGHQSAVSLPHIPGPPAQHRRPGAGVSARSQDMMSLPARGGRRANAVSLRRFDFANSNINDENLNKMNPHHIPDVVSRSASSRVIVSRTNTDP